MNDNKHSWRWQEVAGHLVFLVVFIGVWEFACARGWLDATFFGRPSEIAAYLYQGFVSKPTLWLDLGYTLLGTTVSFVLGSVLAILLGLMFVTYPRFERAADPYLTLLNAMPRIALVPLFLLWFGLGLGSKIAVGTSLSFFIVLANTVAGIRGVSGDLLTLTRSLGASPLQLFMQVTLTAQYLFRQVYPLKGGETILYHAAAGGVGLIACQWARAMGVTMIGTVSTDEKAQLARANGCAHTIVTSREDIVQRVKEITDGEGVPVVYDSVGKDTLEASLDCLQPRGSLISNGTSSGSVVLDTKLLAAKGSIWLTRPAMMHYILPRAHMLDMAKELFDHVLAGRIVSEPKQTFALADAAEAHRALEGRKTTGSSIFVI